MKACGATHSAQLQQCSDGTSARREHRVSLPARPLSDGPSRPLAPPPAKMGNAKKQRGKERKGQRALKQQQEQHERYLDGLLQRGLLGACAGDAGAGRLLLSAENRISRVAEARMHTRAIGGGPGACRVGAEWAGARAAPCGSPSDHRVIGPEGLEHQSRHSSERVLSIATSAASTGGDCLWASQAPSHAVVSSARRPSRLVAAAPGSAPGRRGGRQRPYPRGLVARSWRRGVERPRCRARAGRRRGAAGR